MQRKTHPNRTISNDDIGIGRGRPSARCRARRRCLAVLSTWPALASVAGCATGSRLAPGAQGRWLDAATGQALTAEQAWQRWRHSDLLLLGERHDNPQHQAWRGQWLAGLPDAIVVAEHLPSGARVVWGRDTQASLVAAGFDAKSWRWPLHQGLFEPLQAAGVALWGGNAERDAVRAVARQGVAAMPAQLAAALAGADLAPGAQASLEADLQRGHCGQLPEERLPGMRWAQRARDAAMGLALLAAREAGARPAVLVAGNGHVRRDWGVAQWLAARQPALRVLSVGLLEEGESTREQPYDLLWVTPALPTRPDPCVTLVMPGASR